MESYILPSWDLLRQVDGCQEGRPRHFESYMTSSFGLPWASELPADPDVPPCLPRVANPTSIQGCHWDNMPPILRNPESREWLPPLHSLGLLPPLATSDRQPQRLPQQVDNPSIPRLDPDVNELTEYPYQRRSEDELSTHEEDREKCKKSSSTKPLYRCMVEGCGRKYSYPENLARHNREKVSGDIHILYVPHAYEAVDAEWLLESIEVDWG